MPYALKFHMVPLRSWSVFSWIIKDTKKLEAAQGRPWGTLCLLCYSTEAKRWKGPTSSSSPVSPQSVWFGRCDAHEVCTILAPKTTTRRYKKIKIQTSKIKIMEVITLSGFWGFIIILCWISILFSWLLDIKKKDT